MLFLLVVLDCYLCRESVVIFALIVKLACGTAVIYLLGDRDVVAAALYLLIAPLTLLFLFTLIEISPLP